jgi:hypothetical protein
MILRTFIHIVLIMVFWNGTQPLFAQSSSDSNIFDSFSSVSAIDTNSMHILFLCRSGDQVESNRFSRQFLQASWQEGGVLDYTGTVFPVQVRYRVLDDEMLILSGEDICVLQKPSVQAVQIQDQVFVSVEYVNKREEVEIGYFELLTEGRIRLLRQLSLQNNRVKEQLFLQVDGTAATPYNGRRKMLLSLMNDRQQAMKAFLAEESFRWNDPEDLIIIIDQYHRLRSGT